jgi:hypothetical protein
MWKLWSWKRSQPGFERRGVEEEFLDYTKREWERLRHSGKAMDEGRYQSAVDLVLARLRREG